MATTQRCDICQKESEYPLETLRNVYRSKNINEVCSPCLVVINRKLDKLRHKYFRMIDEEFKVFCKSERSKYLKHG